MKTEEFSVSLKMRGTDGKLYNSAKELSGFINALPLNKEENDTLVKLMIEQVELAEQGAFNQGFK